MKIDYYKANGEYTYFAANADDPKARVIMIHGDQLTLLMSSTIWTTEELSGTWVKKRLELSSRLTLLVKRRLTEQEVEAELKRQKCHSF